MRQVTLSSGSEWASHFRVLAGTTMEVTLAQFWTSPGASTLSGDVAFHGVTVAHAGPQGLAMDGAAGVAQLVVGAGGVQCLQCVCVVGSH